MGDIKISVSGGNAQFGNVTQGDGNTLQSSWQSWCNQEGLQSFDTALDEIQAEGRATAEEVAELRSRVGALAESKDKDSLISKARDLYEDYAWAAEPIKKLFALLL